jgi:RNA polymerase sigma factor (sigma-70 family)
MRLTGRGYDLDLERLADEELVVLAQECDFRPAGEALMRRYHGWAAQLAARRACRSRLQPADTADARQNAVLSLAEAIRCYDTLQVGRCGGCTFRTFLLRVVSARFLDFLRRLGRMRQHCQSSADLAEAPVPDRCGDLRTPCWSDPGGAAQCREEQARLERALAGLDAGARCLWERLAVGTPLRVAARELGLSYDAAKRARRKLLAALTAQLREGAAPERGRPPAR